MSATTKTHLVRLTRSLKLAGLLTLALPSTALLIHLVPLGEDAKETLTRIVLAPVRPFTALLVWVVDVVGPGRRQEPASQYLSPPVIGALGILSFLMLFVVLSGIFLGSLTWSAKKAPHRGDRA